MSGFCEIKLDKPLDNSLLGEFLPSRRISSLSSFLLTGKISVLYSYPDLDDERIITSKKNSALFNKIDYIPNYYYQDTQTTSKDNYDSLQSHRDKLLAFSEFKQEDNKKLRTFNVTPHNARFSGTVKKSLGTEGTIYFNGPEPNLFSDIDFKDLPLQLIKDNFRFTRITGTKFVSKMDYPYYVNNYTINKIGCGLYPFNVLEEIQLDYLTLHNLYGIKGSLQLFKDLKDGSPITSTLISKSEQIESASKIFFRDEIIQQDLKVNSEVSRYKYKKSFTNNKVVLERDDSSIEKLLITSKDISYAEEINDVIKPFKEDQSITINQKNNIRLKNIRNVFSNNDVIKNLSIKMTRDSIDLEHTLTRFTPSGFNIDYSKSNIESLTFLDELD